MRKGINEMAEVRPNQDIRDMLEKKGMYQYQLAYKLKISKYTLNTWMQTPLTFERRQRILDALADTE